MYESATVTGDAERTAFRKAEKKYKLYKNPPKSRERFRSVDLTKVIDFKSILDSLNRDGIIPQGISEFRCDFDRPVFCFDSHPGFYFIPGALSLNQQCRWIRESLMYFPQPPNRTNHNVIYGPIPDLFLASQHQKFFMKLDPPTGNDKMESSTNGCSTTWQWLSSEECANMSKMNSCKAVPASVLLRKLRWSTIGLQFDWSKRNYDLSLPHNKIPDDLCQLAKIMARPAIPIGEIFHPEAAIVNYFGSDDTLGGHLDDMEADWSKPIVSISLGCKGIFLLGGKTREVPPIAMFLRSGDVVLMAGQVRECFHGVPRIFVDPENSEVSELASQLSHPDDSCLLQYIKTSRININIRQVH